MGLQVAKPAANGPPLFFPAHSFSKIVAPGVRFGWMAAGADVIEALATVGQDLGVSQWFAEAGTGAGGGGPS